MTDCYRGLSRKPEIGTGHLKKTMALKLNTSKIGLYEGERNLLRFLAAYREKHSWMPSVIEICEGMGWKSPNAAADCLNRLEKKGAIVMKPNCARCIRIVCEDSEWKQS